MAIDDPHDATPADAEGTHQPDAADAVDSLRQEMAKELAQEPTPAAGQGTSEGTGEETGQPIGRSEWLASDARGPLEKADDAHAALREAAAEGGPASIEADPPVAGASREPPAAREFGASNATAPASTRRTRWVLPVVASILLGAFVGAGSAALVYGPYGSNLLGRQTSEPRLADLTTRLDALEKRPDSQATIADLRTSLGALERKVAALENRPDTPAATAPPATQAVDLAPLEKKVSELQASVDALKTQSGNTGDVKAGLEARLVALEGDVSGAKKASAAVQGTLASVEDRQKQLSAKVAGPAAAVIAESLVQQIAQGQPYTKQVDALATLGADPAQLAVLRQNADKGVLSARMLAARFEPLAEPISASAHKVAPNAGFVDRLKSGMLNMVSIRSTNDTSGTDLPSRVARIKADLARDDVADAVSTWDALPPDAREKSADWGALAKTSAQAIASARVIQGDAVAALGAPHP